MVNILQHPFRVVAGSVAVVDADDDVGTAQQIAVVVMTRRGERPLVPAFGTEDPTFNRVDISDIEATMRQFYPEITIEDAVVTVAGDTQRVEVQYA